MRLLFTGCEYTHDAPDAALMRDGFFGLYSGGSSSGNLPGAISSVPCSVRSIRQPS
jgi:hypothetical protein